MRSIWFIGLLLLSCAHVPSKPPTGLTPEEFWKDQVNRKAVLKYVSAKIDLSFRGEKETVSGSGRVVWEFRDRLRLVLRDPLGREQYVLLFTQNKLQAYYPSKNTLYIDSQSGKTYLKKFLGVNERFPEFQGLWLGVLPVVGSKHKFERWEWDGTAGTYQGVLRIQDSVYHCSVNGKTASLEELRIERDGIVIEIEFEDFERVERQEASASVAHLVKLEMPDERSRVEVEWNELTPLMKEPDSSAFVLSLSPNVEKIVLR